ncbi:hypothetical protein JX265_009030 [Neoarthrinium moseri]|uniref:Uncharacterized protein n=1 Tax=Neoarthrinium moseri TaxID=1658444 RepID=A0A9P9WH71_9PEZI|nr:uncharacterized protein JN550_007900 [Neoarthrinium moseri]KAI1846667.1 hypothetical protein JX266_007240 [Neoarthrinium moseri]KAI1862984.1 hypothetical protein JX265_009030 [Neoarthrinium moseri]KAI1866211.1 hypothetical protein JN550_007900 [Neoarthrinium moseri]
MEKAQEACFSTPEYDAPPPAYSETETSYQAPPVDSKDRLRDVEPASRTNRQFPPSFNAYYQKKLSMTMHLGEHREQPLFAVKMHSGWRGKPGIVLHGGPSSDDPVLASAVNKSYWSRHTTVTLPPLPDSPSESCSEFMQTHTSLKTLTYKFAVEVGDGPNAHREDFEWRHSRGAEIRGLDKHSWGWKLARLGACSQGSGGERNERSLGETSDGKEVVAVWAQNSGWSLTKAYKFEFVGAGLTGEMGERWALMAVITALRIWHIEWTAQNAAAGSSSGAAAGAAAAAA